MKLSLQAGLPKVPGFFQTTLSTDPAGKKPDEERKTQKKKIPKAGWKGSKRQLGSPEQKCLARRPSVKPVNREARVNSDIIAFPCVITHMSSVSSFQTSQRH